MKMTDGHGQRVGSIVRFWNAIESEQGLDHLLYLKFLRVSVPHNRLLHKPGRVLMNRNCCPLGGEHGHAADLSEFQSYFYVGGEKAVFNGTGLWTMTLNHVRKRVRNF